ncbi:MAG: phage integrase SAM-like domain-containing protein [Bacteroidota bacterium]
MKLTIVSKKATNGNVRLLIAYSCQTRVLFATGVIIPLQDFKPGNIEKPVAKSNPNADYLNQTISLLFHELQQIISTLRREDKIPTADVVSRLHRDKTRVVLKPLKPVSFNDLFQTFLDEKNFTAATLKLYKATHSRLIECFPNLDIEKFDANAWAHFRRFLQEEHGLSSNTACIRMKKLKAMLKHMKKSGVEIPIRTFPLPKEEVKKIFLDLKDLRKIIDFEPTSDGLRNVKDLLIFQCHTALRISDLTRLSGLHIKQIGESHFIQMTAYKTNKPLMIPLSKIALDILRKHNFVLPRLTEQYYNKEIKTLLKDAGITTAFEWQAYDLKGNKLYHNKFLYEVFTNHCCSRTAIKYFFSRGYTPDQVSRIVGKSLETIMSYYYERATEDDIVMRTNQLVEPW